MSAGRTIYVASVTAALLLTGCSKSEPTETVEINCENGWRLVREKPVAMTDDAAVRALCPRIIQATEIRKLKEASDAD